MPSTVRTSSSGARSATENQGGTSTSAHSTRRRTRSRGRSTSAAGAASTSNPSRRGWRRSSGTVPRTSTSASPSARRTGPRRSTSPTSAAGRRSTTRSQAPSRIPASTVEQTAVEVRTLDSIFAEHGITAVDVLKVDVEGAEPAVFAGLDLDAVRPRVIVVEGVAPKVGRQAGDEAVAMLVEAGYKHCMFDGLNHYLTSDPDLAYDLSVPANPLDDYVPHAIVRYEAAIADYESDRADSQRRSSSWKRTGDHAAAIAQIERERAELAEPIAARGAPRAGVDGRRRGRPFPPPTSRWTRARTPRRRLRRDARPPARRGDDLDRPRESRVRPRAARSRAGLRGRDPRCGRARPVCRDPAARRGRRRGSAPGRRPSTRASSR